MPARTDSTYGTGRGRLLIAARDVFAERGFPGATTREIAERADITEPLLFRYFGTKVALFEQAAVEPVIAFMEAFIAEWSTREHGAMDAVDEVRGFLTRLIDVISAERELMLVIQAAGEHDPALAPAAAKLREGFRQISRMFESVVEEEFDLRGLYSNDRVSFVRVLVGIVVAFALHGEWLDLGDAEGLISRERMIDEAARIVVFGVRPDVEYRGGICDG